MVLYSCDGQGLDPVGPEEAHHLHCEYKPLWSPDQYYIYPQDEKWLYAIELCGALTTTTTTVIRRVEL